MIKLEKRFQKLSNGETLAYIDVGSGAQTVVLIHGNMASSIHYAPLIERLDRSKYRVVAIDLRGFGDSSYVHRFDSMMELTSDVVELVNILKLPPFTVVGWSAGGGVAMLIGAHYPEMITKLFLINSMSYKGMPVFVKDEKMQPIIGKVYPNKEALANDPLQVAPAVKALTDGNIAFMDYIWKLVIYTVNKPHEEDNLIYLQETMKQRNLVDFDWALVTFNMGSGSNFQVAGDESINKIEAPVRSVWGAKDKTVWEYMVQETVGALGKKAELIVYEECGHSPLVDVPDRLANDLMEFIDK
ncbi:MAG TPA: alpha/beta hydrolase [Bacilli bacterium]|nr:alpha/beta hydrolase [Bacilli bacterium]